MSALEQSRAGGRAADGIVTPEAIVLELETAGVASRVLAGMIDVLVRMGLMIVGALAIGIASAILGIDSDSSFETAYAILLTVVLFGYPVVLETWWRGRTLGKRALGLRAVTVEGMPITVRHATLRMMGGLVDLFVPPGGITGTLFILGTRRHQRVGDLLAGTIVVRDPERTPLPTAIWFPVPYGYDGFAATIDPRLLTREHYTLLRAFILRAKELTADARFAVADELATRVSAVIGKARPPNVHPETYILCVVARYQRLNFGRQGT